MSIARLYDFAPNTTIVSAEVDAELNQLVSEVNLMWKKNASDNITGDPVVVKSTPSLILSGSEASGKNFKIKEDTGVAYLQFDNSGYQSMYILDNANSRHTFQTPGGTSLLKLETSAPSMHVAVANAFFDTYTRPTGTSVGARGVAISGSSGTFSTSSTSYVDVTNLSVTITVTSRPVLIIIGASGTGANVGDILLVMAAGNNMSGRVKIVRDSTDVAVGKIGAEELAAGAFQLGVLTSLGTIDNPGAGTYTYKVQAQCDFGGMSINVRNSKLFVVEL